ncbi:heme-binding domain-containing protein [Elizabethkingia miricola]|nr:heme-binding domain-containing protein [Elizabethkingia miricola]NHQ68418.1 cytochrome P460 [Elizabethkingia miricola]NHQ72524.1 cytochrome P460 [Elizabethkingia miricola]NHQ79505.1 cytochrome P460 [Elizabethkingia miricola]PSL86746.1 cytochrome P460 [Elizabethkingia miricola]QHQ85840.1 cytochrome P460 [Elizabethkingia miricola]
MKIFSKMLKTKNILAFILIVVIGIQFYRPRIIYKPITSEIHVPNDVKAVLERSCFDCHSNQTDLKWFDQIAPAYWLVVDHIKKGKKGLNFSEWDKLPPPVQNAKLWEAFNQIHLGAMPLKSYELLHPEAKLSEKDINLLKKYVASLAPKQKPDTAKVSAYNKQYQQMNTAPSTASLPKALNGISYIPDYKNWKPISSTERFDNGTMRIIFGNDIAVKAAKEHKTNPWPDGTILAKVAWDQVIDSDGNVTTGAFKQIEYMIKDSEKFVSTKGWGWARFLSPKLQPYGKTTEYTNECISCHRPMKDNDFVFTSPLNH